MNADLRSATEYLVALLENANERLRYEDFDFNNGKRVLNLPLTLLEEIHVEFSKQKAACPIMFYVLGTFVKPSFKAGPYNKNLRDAEDVWGKKAEMPWMVEARLRYRSPWEDNYREINLRWAQVLKEPILKRQTEDGSVSVCIADFMTGYQAYKVERLSQDHKKLIELEISNLKDCLRDWRTYLWQRPALSDKHDAAFAAKSNKHFRVGRKPDDFRKRTKQVEDDICTAWRKFRRNTNGTKEEFLKQSPKWEDQIHNYFHKEMKDKKRTVVKQLMLIIDRNRN